MGFFTGPGFIFTLNAPAWAGRAARQEEEDFHEAPFSFFGSPACDGSLGSEWPISSSSSIANCADTNSSGDQWKAGEGLDQR